MDNVTFHETGVTGVRISDPQRRDGRAPFEALSQRALQESRRQRPEYKARLKEAYDFFQGVIRGRIPTYKLEEAMTVSDFPLMFGDILQRELLGNYIGYPVSWPAYVKRGTLPDATRQVKRFTFDGLDGHMDSTNKKPDGTSPKEDAPTEATYSVGPLDVYERVVSINWKAILADDLGAFNDIPNRLAMAARRTEEWLVANLLATSAGPDSTFFTSGNKNQVITANGAASNNPAFSVQGLYDAMKVWNAMVNPVTGEPIVINGSVLVIPRELEVLAASVFNALTVETNAAGFGAALTGLSNSSGVETRLIMNNWLTNGLTRAVNPYLSVVNSTNGTTAWYIVADPSRNRPALELFFLQGEEAPILLRQRTDAERIGGGSADMFGSFETGEIRFKVMHLLATSKADYHSVIASTGAGS